MNVNAPADSSLSQDELIVNNYSMQDSEKDTPEALLSERESIDNGTEKGYDDRKESLKQKTKIQYSPQGIKLTHREFAKFKSSVSTDYFLPYKTHEGLQYQSCVTDNEHILYVYEDGGFGIYNPVAKVSYENIDIANAIVEVLRNAKYNKITEVVNDTLETVEIRRSGYSVYNAYTKKRRSSRGDGALLKRTQKGNSGGVDGSGSGIATTKRGNVSRIDEKTLNSERDNTSVYDTFC